MNKIILILMIVLSFSFFGCSNKSNNDAILDTEVVVNDNEEESKETSNEVVEEKKDLLTSIDEVVEDVVGGYRDNISIYFKNLNTDEEYILNEDTYYVAASTTKVPLAMLILDKVNSGMLSLDDTISYIETDYEEGTGSLAYLETIPDITIDEALYLSIVESDNIAKNMLTRISRSSVTDYTRSITGYSDIPYGNYITARQFGIILEKLYKNPDNDPYYEKLLNYMTRTIFHSGLDKYLDYSKVAHKIGTYYRYYHDVGIVYGEDPYILVVMTKDIGELGGNLDSDSDDEVYLLDGGNKAFDIIAELSKGIYDAVEMSKDI